jgi:Na+/H+ antiporter NhaD/arsenite permease-like protein
MMLSLAIVTLVGEILSSRQFSLHSLSNDSSNESESHSSSPIFRALSKIEMPSILFFLGILMTVAALESLGIVFNLGKSVQESIPINFFVLLLGAGSAVIDNVPLVAASMGMFDLAMDDTVWHFIAYSAGTGGSMLIIGSAAGVVAMGMEKISFFLVFEKYCMACSNWLLNGCLFISIIPKLLSTFKKHYFHIKN